MILFLMDLNEFFKLWGKVSLVEMHKSKEEITYYAKLEYYVRHTNYGTQGDYISDKDALLVPLKEEEYNYLKDKLHNNKLIDPRLLIKGNLEIVIEDTKPKED